MRGHDPKLRIDGAALELLHSRDSLLGTLCILGELPGARLEVVQHVCRVALGLVEVLLAVHLLV